MNARDNAVKHLQHYFRRVWEKAGMCWEADNNSEMEFLVDLILDAVDERHDERAEKRAVEDERLLNEVMDSESPG